MNSSTCTESMSTSSHSRKCAPPLVIQSSQPSSKCLCRSAATNEVPPQSESEAEINTHAVAPIEAESDTDTVSETESEAEEIPTPQFLKPNSVPAPLLPPFDPHPQLSRSISTHKSLFSSPGSVSHMRLRPPTALTLRSYSGVRSHLGSQPSVDLSNRHANSRSPSQAPTEIVPSSQTDERGRSLAHLQFLRASPGYGSGTEELPPQVTLQDTHPRSLGGSHYGSQSKTLPETEAPRPSMTELPTGAGSLRAKSKHHKYGPKSKNGSSSRPDAPPSSHSTLSHSALQSFTSVHSNPPANPSRTQSSHLNAILHGLGRARPIPTPSTSQVCAPSASNNASSQSHHPLSSLPGVSTMSDRPASQRDINATLSCSNIPSLQGSRPQNPVEDARVDMVISAQEWLRTLAGVIIGQQVSKLDKSLMLAQSRCEATGEKSTTPVVEPLANPSCHKKKTWPTVLPDNEDIRQHKLHQSQGKPTVCSTP